MRTEKVTSHDPGRWRKPGFYVSIAGIEGYGKTKRAAVEDAEKELSRRVRLTRAPETGIIVTGTGTVLLVTSEGYSMSHPDVRSDKFRPWVMSGSVEEDNVEFPQFPDYYSAAERAASHAMQTFGGIAWANGPGRFVEAVERGIEEGKRYLANYREVYLDVPLDSVVVWGLPWKPEDQEVASC